ncbi:4'-phosphopantetheinyl transferase superfamily protein [Streptomyces sp. CC208A]|uniref:4'-phosphopantetheinyl transferase family protein n=1 Tax=Streptomyces sp. CC208A TaxID=3044573 RepID=UPI0024A8EC75|nr:4'-phosphopantetheinyl transferase superfamily protein [Streptomyces sp. CC208A]
MIEEVLPAPHVAVEAFGDPREPWPLFAEEERCVAGAVPGRRREFATTRACARAALARLGETPGPIPRGPRGAPVWPRSTVGSMTHCDGYRAAVVARSDAVLAVGLDAEPHLPLGSQGVLRMVLVPQERAHLTALAVSDPDVCWDRLLFSAKESVYKAWSSLTGSWLGFEEATVTVDVPAGAFTAVLARPARLAEGLRVTRFRGRWAVRRGLLLTAVSLPRTSPDLRPRRLPARGTD